jgi:hypothetical protein
MCILANVVKGKHKGTDLRNTILTKSDVIKFLKEANDEKYSNDVKCLPHHLRTFTIIFQDYIDCWSLGEKKLICFWKTLNMNVFFFLLSNPETKISPGFFIAFSDNNGLNMVEIVRKHLALRLNRTYH